MPAPRQPAPPVATPDRPGTVYRAAPEHQPVVDPPTDGGSLTGFILSRGRTDAPAQRGRMVLIAVVILLMIAVLAAIGLVTVGTVFDRLLGD